MKKQHSLLSFLVFIFLFSFNSYSQTGKAVFLELKTEEPSKGAKEDASQIIEYIVPVGKYLKIESAITSPVTPNSGVSFLYLNGKMIANYAPIRPQLVIVAPFPIYLPAGKYQLKLSGNLSNAFISGMEY